MDKLKGILEKNPNIGLDEDTVAVANSSFSNQTKRISLRGGVFRKIVGGKEVSTANSSIMNIIIIKMAHNPSRVYYKDSYEEGKRVSPVCWSNNSKNPDVEVRKPQAKSCHTCPNSVRGSGFGGVSTSCRLSWRVAIVLANDPEGDILELVLPSNSCFGKEEQGRWPFKTYVQMLATNNVSAGRIVTRMQFDPNSIKPRALFSPVEAAEDWVLEVIKDQAEKQAAYNAIKLTVYQVDEEDREPVKFEAFEASNEEKAKVKSAKEAKSINEIMDKWRDK
ncbi:MAG: hypothetical protein Tp1100SUR639781_64 [Prokaryotic dsDNA virus sp.]|nr:MAG: hypothetical protein Tp1100SUR639781_64 [Prokaryotic dsDNA virus sp.]|tara:strand:+ start:19551 stop:20384 length:834 start_codon:yes stop_codon:yes gene_type:complete